MSDLDNEELEATRKLNVIGKENEIEVGEYVRTKNGEIGKVRVVIQNMIFINENQYFYDLNKIKSHSKNIKDLIEEEDCLIYKLKGINLIGKEFVKKHIDPRSHKENLSIRFYSLEQIEIFQIVTKEQFESVKYEV